MRHGWVVLVLLAACSSAKPNILQGYAEADYVYLAPRDAGYVAALNVKEGDEVAAGAAVFRLDVERSNATLSKAQAMKTSAGDTTAAQAQAVAAAQADVNLARVTYNRSLTLFQKGFAAKAQVDQDKAALDAAAARLRTAVAQRKAAASQTGASNADVALAKSQSDDRVVEAPSAGRIERIFLRPGEFANAGSPVASLLTPANMRLRFFAPEALLAQLKLGGIIDVACDSCAKGLTARISYIATEPQFTPPVIYSKEERAKLVYLVEARPDHPEQFRPGQPVDLSVRK